MKWMRERDLLIAQTMAFVQSVSGKNPDNGSMIGPEVIEPESSRATLAAAPIAEIEAVLREPPAADSASKSSRPVQTKRTNLHDDLGAEVRARVASFRANQQRFLREREEYCSATMAKVHASLRKQAERPPSGG